MSDVLRYKDLMMDISSHAVTVGEQPVLLTKTDFAITCCCKMREQVIAKSVILDRISEDTMDCTETSLKTYMSHLRSNTGFLTFA